MLNAADIAFLKAMVPHHRMAVEMAEKVIDRGLDMRVDALARKIREAQTMEIAKMTAWLTEAGQEAPPM